MLHVCTGTGTVCSTVTAQRYMCIKVLELSAKKKKKSYILFTGTETVCSTVEVQCYFFVQGLKLSAVG
jgi:uncharacterized protein YsxB (DUF464 family)